MVDINTMERSLESGLLLDDFDATCPCRRRWLQGNDKDEDDNDSDIILWQVIYTCAVLFYMFAALLSDRFGADSVMMTSLTLFLASGIISVQEGLAGFSNQGLLTVLCLFVVAEGISKTGALDWYMGKMLGRPSTAASAQLRLMVPISIVSAFLNNTPVVAVMIPIVQRWAKNIHISAQQLLIPLSFASILGGTCTLIGTSTNLVVVGLLEERYPNDPSVKISLFELGKFGVPVAFAGIAYILFASPFLLPGGSGGGSKNSDKDGVGAINLDGQEDVLLGALLTPWSPAAGRSVKRSGLRDTGGIYLVSVHRAATGNVHRAVGQDFVLNVGDILYFTGLIEGFGEFCEEHGMEVLTNEIANNAATTEATKTTMAGTGTSTNREEVDEKDGVSKKVEIGMTSKNELSEMLVTVVEGACENDGNEETIPCEVGVTKKSLMQADEAERSRSITRMIDLIRGHAREEPTEVEDSFHPRGWKPQHGANKKPQNDLIGPQKVVVTSENEFVIVGVNAPDRPGLLLDISKGLSRLGLNLRHTEASVVKQRSISIWRCELISSDLPDLEEIWSVLNALLENDGGSQAVKLRGLRVIRAVVAKTSKLVGKTAAEVDFRKTYKAGVIAVQKGGKNVALGSVVFGPGDVLVLQASEDSPLLRTPPDDFYKRISEAQNKDAGSLSRSGSIASFIKNKITKSRSNVSLENTANHNDDNNNDNQKQDENASNDMEEAILHDENGGLTGEASDDDYNVGSGTSLEDNEAAVEVTNEAMVSDMQAILADEEVWKDLHVILANTERNADEGSGTREFLAAMEVAPKSQLANRTVAESGLDKLPGVYLVSIDRPSGKKEEEPKNKVKVITRRADGSFNDDLSVANTAKTEPVFKAVAPEMPLMVGDVLWYAGSASAVGDLRKVPGLVSFESEEVKKMAEKVHDRRLVEAVVARRGPLVGKTVKEVRFRTKFGAAVIAVHREGKRIHDHPGKIKLQAGDVLLLEAGPSFIKGNIESDKSFALVAEVEDSAPPRLSLLIPALVITVAMLAVYTAGVAPLLICALVASILMVCLGILSEQEVRDAVNWEVFIIIAAAFGIGTAMVNSGVAGVIANFLVDVGDLVGLGDAGLLGAVYFATFLISNVVTNNAAAALLFPIALDAAEQTGIDRKIMSYCLMLGASASFMSPFGYTTNLLIYGPGGYKYKDFLSIGTPMQIILWILSIAVLSTGSSPNWWISWVGTLLALIAVFLGGNIKQVILSSLVKNVAEEDKGKSITTGTISNSQIK